MLLSVLLMFFLMWSNTAVVFPTPSKAVVIPHALQLQVPLHRGHDPVYIVGVLSVVQHGRRRRGLDLDGGLLLARDVGWCRRKREKQEMAATGVAPEREGGPGLGRGRALRPHGGELQGTGGRGTRRGGGAGGGNAVEDQDGEGGGEVQVRPWRSPKVILVASPSFPVSADASRTYLPRISDVSLTYLLSQCVV